MVKSFLILFVRKADYLQRQAVLKFSESLLSTSARQLAQLLISSILFQQLITIFKSIKAFHLYLLYLQILSFLKQTSNLIIKTRYKMAQLKSQNPATESNPQKQLGEQLLQETLKVETQKSGVFANFFNIAAFKTQEILMNIIGDYGYETKNEFNYNQKKKMLGYLHSKVLTDNIRLRETDKIKFADFDQNFLDQLPEDYQALRNKILKGRTNLDAASQTLQRFKNSRDAMTIRYLNEQAYENDKTKYNSMAWGLLFGAFLNCTIYKHGNSIRKAALFMFCGHIMGIVSYLSNLNRYFDSVYPIFERDAVEFSKQEKLEFQDWKPQGQIVMEQ